MRIFLPTAEEQNYCLPCYRSSEQKNKTTVYHAIGLQSVTKRRTVHMKPEGIIMLHVIYYIIYNILILSHIIIRTTFCAP